MINYIVILLSFILILMGQKLIPKYINGFKSDAIIRRITFCLVFTVPFFLKEVNIHEQNLDNFIDGASFMDLLQPYILPMLILAAAYYAIGILTLKYFEHKNRVLGTLD